MNLPILHPEAEAILKAREAVLDTANKLRALEAARIRIGCAARVELTDDRRRSSACIRWDQDHRRHE